MRHEIEPLDLQCIAGIRVGEQPWRSYDFKYHNRHWSNRLGTRTRSTQPRDVPFGLCIMVSIDSVLVKASELGYNVSGNGHPSL